MKGFVETTKRQILVSQSPHSGILVTEHTEGSTRVREKV